MPKPLCRILYVEDEPDIRFVAKMTLEAVGGFTVIACACGQEALMAAYDAKADLLLLDVMMPGMDGWAVLNQLKADAELSHIPVIMVTIVDAQNMGFSLGAVEYLTKPIDWQRLLKLLHRYGDGHLDQPVLIVEDNPQTRELLRRNLTNQGWKTVEAENGRIALEMLETISPALILLDLIMPEMDGFEFLNVLRRDKRWHRIPVIVVTAREIDEEDRKRLVGQVSQIVQKGYYDPDKLIEQIRELIRIQVFDFKI